MNTEQAWDHFVRQVMNVAGGIEEPTRAIAAGKLYAAHAVAEARAPLVALGWLAQELGTVIEIRSLRLDIIGTKPLPRKYAPDGIAYRLNGRNDREPPKLIPREEVAARLAAALAKETP